MQAAVVDAAGAGFKIAEVELAHPLGREVLIDVRASGLCHTDLTIATQDVGVSRCRCYAGTRSRDRGRDRPAGDTVRGW